MIEIGLCSLVETVPANIESDEQYADVAYYAMKMIEIASDNHIGELTKLSKSDVKDGLRYSNLCTVEEFEEQVDSGFVNSDETAMWACEYDGSFYTGDSIDIYDMSDQPEWATHVYWYGK